MRGIVSRQHQHAATHKEWEILQWKENKHIKAKFFFIKDRVDSGEIRVIDCPAEEMWADVLTKPLQGMAFRSMRSQLMNCAINYEDEEEKTNTETYACTRQQIGDLERHQAPVFASTAGVCWT